MGSLKAPGEGGKPIGELPPKLREKILQSRNEGFPPGYEEILKSYFRSLSEGRGGGAKDEEDSSKPR